MSSSAPSITNRLLSALPTKVLDRLRAHMEPVSLALRQVVEVPHEAISHIYFPESGILSMVAGTQEKRLELGIIGREGMTGISVVLGAETSPHECFVQAEGGALRISAEHLKQSLEAEPPLRALLLLYVRAFLLQTEQTLVANRHCTIEERLARWLLMCRDRLDHNDIPVTHEFLSLMLGVRRPGVTIAVNRLEECNLIRTARGRIAIADRARLEAVAGSVYSAESLTLVEPTRH